MSQLTFCHPIPFCTAWKINRTIDEGIIHRMRTETTEFIGVSAREIKEMIVRGFEIQKNERSNGIVPLSDTDVKCLNVCSLYEFFLDKYHPNG